MGGSGAALGGSGGALGGLGRALGGSKNIKVLFWATVSNWLAPGLRLALVANTAHVLRLNKVDVLALNKAYVLRLNTKICPVFTANTKETTKGGGRRPPPFVEAAEGRLLCVGCEHWACLSVETQDMCLVESQDI